MAAKLENVQICNIERFPPKKRAAFCSLLIESGLLLLLAFLDIGDLTKTLAIFALREVVVLATFARFLPAVFHQRNWRFLENH